MLCQDKMAKRVFSVTFVSVHVDLFVGILYQYYINMYIFSYYCRSLYRGNTFNYYCEKCFIKHEL